MYREFYVPSDAELEASLGVAPGRGDEVGVRRLELLSGDGYSVVLTADALGPMLPPRSW